MISRTSKWMNERTNGKKGMKRKPYEVKGGVSELYRVTSNESHSNSSERWKNSKVIETQNPKRNHIDERNRNRNEKKKRFIVECLLACEKRTNNFGSFSLRKKQKQGELKF